MIGIGVLPYPASPVTDSHGRTTRDAGESETAEA